MKMLANPKPISRVHAIRALGQAKHSANNIMPTTQTAWPAASKVALLKRPVIDVQARTPKNWPVVRPSSSIFTKSGRWIT